ncbi:MAG: hypothetical protein AAF631_08815 [Pseudomonadota bacterium]
MRLALILLLVGVLAALAPAPPASAQGQGCYADYKAQRTASGGQLQLHYGVIRLRAAACASPPTAARIVARRIAGDGWQLLTVMSTFDDSGLTQRRGNAGQFFLRY